MNALFESLLLPPGGLLLVLLAACWLRRRAPRLASVGVVLGVSGLWLMSLPVTVHWAARLLESEPALVQAQWSGLSERAGAIVVLGGGRQRQDPAWGGDQPSPLALERVRYAARLARASGLPILTAGGLHRGQPPSEARLMAEVLARDHGLSVRWQEGGSRSTWENAQHSAAILRQAGISRVVLVTQAWHMPRARWSFERAGLEVLAAPLGFLAAQGDGGLDAWLPDAKALWQSSLLLREAIGRIVYPLLHDGGAAGARESPTLLERLGQAAGQ